MNEMNRGFDSHFGPASQPINVSEFLQEANSAGSSLLSGALTNPAWEQLSHEQRDAVEAEVTASISELKSSIEEVWDSPLLSAHVLRQHESTIASVYDQADVPGTRKRKRKRLEGSESAPGVPQLQDKLDSVNLTCWGLTAESALCIRAAKNTDYNALDKLKKTGAGVLRTPSHKDVGAVCSSAPDSLRSPSPDAPSCPDAIISLTVYNRIPYLPSCLARSSQHAVLSTQTLDDLLRVIPCASSNLPVEKLDAEGDVSGYSIDDQGVEQHSGCLFCIEGLLYGDRRDNTDYAEKLMSHLQKLPEEKRPQIKAAATSTSETTFNALTLRLHQPYWLLHQGNCEHFIVLDQIRHACFVSNFDPLSGYPLMLHLTPTLLDLCRACSKVPAVYSVVGDMRLGESPCLLCAPCWRTMGLPPKNYEGMMVIPLVKH
ncbi:hypothetical protein AZE42_01906 [Rhizopogon vesiculosus]|uniref:snRNA-activating protein complex subunit 3 n=1 Tax=Rhizopogon vesiculosus TaxID=180088 RepID=A0A1J8QI36_9AGAM|nr:hypothetical protein AZE42_01906 [Rhizopogon vesiculosus]